MHLVHYDALKRCAELLACPSLDVLVKCQFLSPKWWLSAYESSLSDMPSAEAFQWMNASIEWSPHRCRALVGVNAADDLYERLAGKCARLINNAHDHTRVLCNSHASQTRLPFWIAYRTWQPARPPSAAPSPLPQCPQQRPPRAVWRSAAPAIAAAACQLGDALEPPAALCGHCGRADSLRLCGSASASAAASAIGAAAAATAATASNGVTGER